ncbi:MAG: amidohydrolase [Clostridia bacterium]|nr:amidohydrolase [Clostridia bacterium]
MTDKKIISLCEEFYPLARDIRRKLHSYPERGNREFRTTELIFSYLEKWGYECERLLDTGVVAVLKGNAAGKTVALRADIDALAVTEKTGLFFSSENTGVMHACGHDIHTASLLGAAKVLAAMKNELKGTVKLIFQPDEEGDGGAQRLIEKGVMKDVDEIYGIHIRPELRTGSIMVKYGKFYAASDIIEIDVKGTSAHCAEPHKSVDAILIGSHIVTALQSLVSREINPTDSAVITVGTFNGGSFRNTVAGSCSLTGVARSLGKETRMLLRKRIKETAEGIAEAMGGKAEVRIIESYPGIVNDDEKTAYIESCAAEILGKGNVAVGALPLMTTEDFGYYLDCAKGCFYHVGCECDHCLHSEYFNPDESSILTSMIMHVKSVMG